MDYSDVNEIEKYDDDSNVYDQSSLLRKLKWNSEFQFRKKHKRYCVYLKTKRSLVSECLARKGNHDSVFTNKFFFCYLIFCVTKQGSMGVKNREKKTYMQKRE